VGVTACQVGWVCLLGVPASLWLLFAPFLGAIELAVPIWAERAGPTSWHPRHIAERYGLFTLIVLGESVLAATLAIQSALDESGTPADLIGIVGGGLLTVFAMWWLYFAKPVERLLVAIPARVPVGVRTLARLRVGRCRRCGPCR
jgi:low temperature requirement protein LtrA